MNARIEKMFKLPFYQRALLLIGLLALIGAGFYFLLYAPLIDESAQLQQQIEQREVQLLKDRRIARDLPRYRQEYEALQAELEEALIELPNKKEIPTLLTNISNLAKEQGLEILLFKPMGEVNKGFYAEVPVDIRLLGSYQDVAMFFYQVGQLSRIVNISNVQMENARNEGRALLNVNCRATTFRFVENPPDKKGS